MRLAPRARPSVYSIRLEKFPVFPKTSGLPESPFAELMKQSGEIASPRALSLI